MYLNMATAQLLQEIRQKAKAAAVKENIKRLGIQGITAEVKDACEYYEDDF